MKWDHDNLIGFENLLNKINLHLALTYFLLLNLDKQLSVVVVGVKFTKRHSYL